MADTYSGLLAGLGNPGPKYADTRHNFGFMVLDALLETLQRDRIWQVRTLQDKPEKHTLWRLDGPGVRWLAVKPLAYMNLSGEAVGQVARYYRVATEDIFVLHDELDLPMGRMKLKQGGGPAGHNGIKSIINHLSSQDFFRLRLGVGRPAPGETREFVLTGVTPDERPLLNAVVQEAVAGMQLVLKGERRKGQECCNRFRIPPPEASPAEVSSR